MASQSRVNRVGAMITARGHSEYGSNRIAHLRAKSPMPSLPPSRLVTSIRIFNSRTGVMPTSAWRENYLSTSLESERLDTLLSSSLFENEHTKKDGTIASIPSSGSAQTAEPHSQLARLSIDTDRCPMAHSLATPFDTHLLASADPTEPRPIDPRS